MFSSTLFGISSLLILKVAGSLFLAFTFLQSGADKMTDFKGNLEYLSNHFKNSPLRNSIGLFLPLIMVAELLTGLLSLIGVLFLFYENSTIGFLGAVLAMATLLVLFLGQRLAKDYAGAAGIVPYLTMTFLILAIYSI